MKKNEIIEVLSSALATKFENRAVVYYKGDRDGEAILIDFANSDGTAYEGDTMCVWSHQRDLPEGGSEELGYGYFNDLLTAFQFFTAVIEGQDVDFIVETF